LTRNPFKNMLEFSPLQIQYTAYMKESLQGKKFSLFLHRKGVFCSRNNQ
jgi:hypothetical protein